MHAEPRECGEPRVEVAELAGIDPGLQDVFDPLLVLPPAAAELFGSLGSERGELVEEDPDVIGVPVDDVEQLVAQHRELRRRCSARRGDAVGTDHHLVHHPIVDRGKEFFLRFDVVVEGALAETVDRAQFRDPGGVVTLAREDRAPRCRRSRRAGPSSSRCVWIRRSLRLAALGGTVVQPAQEVW